MRSGTGRRLCGAAAAVGVLVGVGLAVAQNGGLESKPALGATGSAIDATPRHVEPPHTRAALLLEQRSLTEQRSVIEPAWFSRSGSSAVPQDLDVGLSDPWSPTSSEVSGPSQAPPAGRPAATKALQSGTWAKSLPEIVDPWQDRLRPRWVPALHEIVDPWVPLER